MIGFLICSIEALVIVNSFAILASIPLFISYGKNLKETLGDFVSSHMASRALYVPERLLVRTWTAVNIRNLWPVDPETWMITGRSPSIHNSMIPALQRAVFIIQQRWFLPHYQLLPTSWPLTLAIQPYKISACEKTLTILKIAWMYIILYYWP